MQVWIYFIALIISLVIAFKYTFFDYQFIPASFWTGCTFLLMRIWFDFPSTTPKIIYWFFTITLLLTGITGYLFGEDSLATQIVLTPFNLIIGVVLLFLLIGGLLGGLSNSNSTKNTTYSVKGTFDGKNFEAKAKKDK